jgi:hypothetical protein
MEILFRKLAATLLRFVPGNRSKITDGPVLMSFSYVKQSWDSFTFRNSDWLVGTFRWSEDSSRVWLVPSPHRRSHLLKRGFFRQVRELKIPKKQFGEQK